MPPYPLTCEGVGMWLVARWERRGLMSNPTNTRPLVSALTHHARLHRREALSRRLGAAVVVASASATRSVRGVNVNIAPTTRQRARLGYGSVYGPIESR